MSLNIPVIGQNARIINRSVILSYQKDRSAMSPEGFAQGCGSMA